MKKKKQRQVNFKNATIYQTIAGIMLLLTGGHWIFLALSVAVAIRVADTNFGFRFGKGRSMTIYFVQLIVVIFCLLAGWRVTHGHPLSGFSVFYLAALQVAMAWVSRRIYNREKEAQAARKQQVSTADDETLDLDETRPQRVIIIIGTKKDDENYV